MLAKSAEEDIRSWTLAKHTPTTFVTTFEYTIEAPERCVYTNGRSTLELPLYARIAAPGVMTCDTRADR
jgi:hypothetical protein